MTFRFHGHLLGDADGYMDKQQKKDAMAADPVPRFRALLLSERIATEAELVAIEAAAESEILEAIEFALGSAWPDIQEMKRDVYATEVSV
jgi:pyruvate dehydrogenase E1 component alpha subunit